MLATRLACAPVTHWLSACHRPLLADNIFFAALVAENQLIAVNPVQGLTLTPAIASALINTQQTLTATVVDSADGDAPLPGVTVTFSISGAGAQDLTAITNANGEATVTFTSAAVGTSTVLASATDAPSRFATITWTAPVNSAPSCAEAVASPGALWPPNHKLVPVSVTVPDVDGDAVTVTITGVNSTQPTRGRGSGNTCPDATLAPLSLRSERTGTDRAGRFYSVAFNASDGELWCTGTVVVCVPHSAGVPCPANTQAFSVDATKC